MNKNDLRLVILEDREVRRLKVVHPTYPVDSGFMLDEKAGIWKNGYESEGKHRRIGGWDYWSGYRNNTVVAVIDPGNIDHLNVLADLRYEVEQRYDRDRSSGREASI